MCPKRSSVSFDGALDVVGLRHVALDAEHLLAAAELLDCAPQHLAVAAR